MLEEYNRKRIPGRTPEPFGDGPRVPSASGGMFVVHKHHAHRLHYDFRLEMEGVLRSWAVPKGPSLNVADKRLAVMVEDHPLDYANFEGVIPAGNYGAGGVIVWDRGTYRVIDPAADAADAVRDGKLDIELRGFKLQGAFTMVRTSGRGGKARPSRDSDKPQWLLIKKRDEYASTENLLEERPRSVLSGLTVEEMRNPLGPGTEIAGELDRIQAPTLKTPMAPKAFTFGLAKLLREPVQGDGWLVELKYDGVRAFAFRDGASVRIIGRSGLEITAKYPEVALALGALPYKRFAVDGEIVAPGDDGRPSFQALQRRIQARDPDQIGRFALGAPVFYHAFDLLAFDRFDLRDLEIETRKAMLRRMIHDEGPLRYVDHHVGDAVAFYDAVCKARLEGIVAKRALSAYPIGRTGAWVKIKCPTVGRFVIGGWTEPAGSRAHFGALLLGQYEAPGVLRFVGRVGTGFDEDALRALGQDMRKIQGGATPFRTPSAGEPAPPRGSHFCTPTMVCEVRFSEWTGDGSLRHPSFLGLVSADPRECLYRGPHSKSYRSDRNETSALQDIKSRPPAPRSTVKLQRASGRHETSKTRQVEITNSAKIFWPAEGYTKHDLITYYETIAPWILPYLKDRPVVLTRYPNGIDGKSFFQKDAPEYAPSWIRRARIYSEDSRRDISYFIIDSADALAYIANLGAIPIHIWSSRVPHLNSPDWLLFDLDPKGSTTELAVRVAIEIRAVLIAAGMRPYVKTSGQAGLHVMVGLKPGYSYRQARMFLELVARIVVDRAPEAATIERDTAARGGKVYIDYLQLGEGKTIAAPFAARPQPGAPVSAPLRWDELKRKTDPGKFNIKSMPARMRRLGSDPFLGVIDDPQEIEPALEKVESLLNEK